MKTLELNQMENVEAGSCFTSGAGMGMATIGLIIATGPLGAAIAGISFVIGMMSVADSCLTPADDACS